VNRTSSATQAFEADNECGQRENRISQGHIQFCTYASWLTSNLHTSQPPTTNHQPSGNRSDRICKLQSLQSLQSMIDAGSPPSLFSHAIMVLSNTFDRSKSNICDANQFNWLAAPISGDMAEVCGPAVCAW